MLFSVTSMSATGHLECTWRLQMEHQIMDLNLFLFYFLLGRLFKKYFNTRLYVNCSFQIPCQSHRDLFTFSGDALQRLRGYFLFLDRKNNNNKKSCASAGCCRLRILRLFLCKNENSFLFLNFHPNVLQKTRYTYLQPTYIGSLKYSVLNYVFKATKEKQKL